MYLKKSSLGIRSAEGARMGLLPLFVTSAVCEPRVRKISAADSKNHHQTEECLLHHDSDMSKFEHLLRKAAEVKDAVESISLGCDCNFMGLNGVTPNAPVRQDPVIGGQR
jgi:hypothetical protein